MANGLRLVPKTVTLKDERARREIDVTFPQVEGTRDPAFLHLNRHIREFVAKKYAWLLPRPTKDDLLHYEKFPGACNSVNLNYYVFLSTDRFLSIYVDTYGYGIRAAHSVQQSITVNFDMKTKRLLTLDALFKPGTRPLEFISEYCLEELAQGHSSINDPVFRKEVDPLQRNFASWNILPDGICINFDACKIDGCAAGVVNVLVPFAELKSLMRPEFARD